MLAISVLGSVGARRDGVEVELGGPRQRAVLALLVAAGRGRLVSVDRFVEDLWDGEPPPKALSALHAYVSRLRRVLDPDRDRGRPATTIETAPPGYRLNLPVDAVDAWLVESLVARARRENDPRRVLALTDEVAQVWQGEPYAAYADQGWAGPAVEQLTELAAAAVELRAVAQLDLYHPNAAVTALLGHVRDHPLRESAVELLATALYRDGRQAEALAAISRIKTELADELGVDAGPALLRLEHDVLTHAAHLDRPASLPRADPVEQPFATEGRSVEQPTGGEFVGREPELARLLRALGAVSASGRAGVVWLHGEAGIGKSTVTERLADLTAADTVAVRGRCAEIDGAPAGWPWREVLTQLRQRSNDDAGPGAAGDDEPQEAFALEQAIARALQPYVSGPVLMLLDDLHRGDDETLQVLRQLTATLRQPVLVVATYRTDQFGPALAATIAATGARTVDQLQLAGLDDTAAEAMLQRFGRRVLPQAARTQLVERSAGNPLFLRELGQLVAAEGAAAGLAVPPVIGALLTRRIERLPAEVVELLARAAVLGRDVDVDLLIAMERAGDGLGEDAVLDALDTGVVAGLLDLPTPGSLRFTHVLTRDTLHERLPPFRRLRLHQLALSVLERDHPERTSALAHHALAGLDSRTAARAASHLEAAAAAAEGHGVYSDVVRHAAAALTALDLLPVDPDRRLRLLRRLGHGQSGVGNVVAARAVREEAVALASRSGTRRDVAEQLTWDTPTVWIVRPLGQLDRPVVAHLEQALAAGDPSDVELRVRLLATLVLETEASELTPRAEEAAEELRSLLPEVGDPAVVCAGLNAVYFVTSPPRPPQLHREVGEQLLQAAIEGQLTGFRAVAHHLLFGAAAGEGDLERAQQEAELAVQHAAAGQLPGLLGVSALFGGARQLVGGRLSEAQATYDAVTQAMAEAGDPNAGGMAALLSFAVAHAAERTGELHENLMAFVDADPLPARDLIVRSRLALGDRVGAATLAATLKPLTHSFLWDFFAAVRLENAAELGLHEQTAAGYRALEPFRGRLAGLSSGSMTLGPVDYVLGRAAVALGHDAAAREHFAAAVELARGLGHREWTAQAQRELSRIVS